MKHHQTKERKPSQRQTHSQAQSAWPGHQLFQKSFLHTSDFPYFSISLAILAKSKWSDLRYTVMWPYGFM